MLFYMQMRNWFIIFVILTMTYMIHQRMTDARSKRYNMATAAGFSIFR